MALMVQGPADEKQQHKSVSSAGLLTYREKKKTTTLTNNSNNARVRPAVNVVFL